jgi:hypothetical protein
LSQPQELHSLNCVQGGIYLVLGLVAVSFGVPEPSAWPPFHGSPEGHALNRFCNHVLLAYSVAATVPPSIIRHQTIMRKLSQILFHRASLVPTSSWHSQRSIYANSHYLPCVLHHLDNLASCITAQDSGAMFLFPSLKNGN